MVGVLALAAYLRLAHLDLMEFKGDQAIFLGVARLIAETGQIPLVGPLDSLGVHAPPFLLYLAAIPLLLSGSPLAVAGVIAATNILAVFLCYRFTRRYFGSSEAVVASLLYATSFWAIFYSFKIWRSTCLVLPSFLFVSALFSVVVDNKPRGAIWALLWLGVALQFHLGALPLALIFALVFLLFRSKFQWRCLLAGGVLFTFVSAPYLYWEVSHHFYNLRTLLGASSGPPTYDLSSLYWATHLISSHGYTTFFGISSGQSPVAPLGLEAVEFGLLLLFGSGLLYVLARVARERLTGPLSAKGRGYLLLLLWLVVPVGFYVRHTVEPQVQRFLVLYPAQFIIMAVGGVAAGDLLGQVVARTRLRRSGLAVRIALGTLLMIACLYQVWAFKGFMAWLDGGGVLTRYGLPLKHQMRAVERAQVLSTSRGQQSVSILAHNGLGPHDGLADAMAFLSWRRFPFSVFDENRVVVLPRARDEPAVVLTTFDYTPAGQLMRRHFADYEVDSVPHPGGHEALRLYVLPPGTAWRAGVEPDGAGRLPLAFDNGVHTLAYELSPRIRPEEEAVLTLYWGIEDLPPKRGNFRFFHHLIEEAGKGWGGWDGIEYSAGQWQAGDAVVSWHRVRLLPGAPPGRYWMEFGMYDLDTLQRVDFVDGRSGLRGSAICIGPLEVTGDFSVADKGQ